MIAYVFTRDLARDLRVSEKIEAGMIGLNRGLASDPAARLVAHLASHAAIMSRFDDLPLMRLNHDHAFDDEGRLLPGAESVTPSYDQHDRFQPHQTSTTWRPT